MRPTQRLLIFAPDYTATSKLVRALSEIPVEMPPPDANPSVIAMRFGRLTLGEDLRLYIFGLPWGLAFREMWDVIGRDVYAVIAAAAPPPPHDTAPPTMPDALRAFAGPARLLLLDTAAFNDPRAVLATLLTAQGDQHLLGHLATLDFGAL